MTGQPLETFEYVIAVVGVVAMASVGYLMYHRSYHPIPDSAASTALLVTSLIGFSGSGSFSMLPLFVASLMGVWLAIEGIHVRRKTNQARKEESSSSPTPSPSCTPAPTKPTAAKPAS